MNSIVVILNVNFRKLSASYLLMTIFDLMKRLISYNAFTAFTVFTVSTTNEE